MSKHAAHRQDAPDPDQPGPASGFGLEVVPPAGVEPATCPLGRGRSIRLSYGGEDSRVYPAADRPSTTRRATARTLRSNASSVARRSSFPQSRKA